MYERKNYLEQLQKFADENSLKIISGVSGCGKSELVKEIRDTLKEQNKHVHYFDFEITSWDKISEYFSYIIELKGQEIYYVIIDNFNPTFAWEKTIISLLENNVSVFITTSNYSVYSKFIKDEKDTSKYRIIKVRTFSYNEMSEYAKSRDIDYDVYEYIKFGGFPDLLDCKSDVERRKKLSERLNRITSEIIARYNIRKSRLFNAFTRMVVCNESPLMPFLAMAKRLSETEKCSANTLTQWMVYLKEAFLVETVARFSDKDRDKDNRLKKLKSKRYYICDHAFRVLGTDADELIEQNYETAFYKCISSFGGCLFSEYRKNAYKIHFYLPYIDQYYFSCMLDYDNYDTIKITHAYKSQDKYKEEQLSLESFFKLS